MYTQRPDYEFFRRSKRIPREEVESRILRWIQTNYGDPEKLCEFYNKCFPRAPIAPVFTMDFQRIDYRCIDESQDANDNPMLHRR